MPTTCIPPSQRFPAAPSIPLRSNSLPTSSISRSLPATTPSTRSISVPNIPFTCRAHGVAYVLGPYEGKAAGAIGALIWRGTVQYHVNPNSLQVVSWAIQSGLTYSQMPKSYQAIVDQVIPDYKSEITADFFVEP